MASKKKMNRGKPVTDSERMRVATFAEYGFHYRYIAKRIYGQNNSRYSPSLSEIARVGKIAREEGVSSLDWRRGDSDESRTFASSLLRAPNSKFRLTLSRTRK